MEALPFKHQLKICSEREPTVDKTKITGDLYVRVEDLANVKTPRGSLSKGFKEEID